MVSIHKIKNREGKVYVRMYEGWRENGKTKTAVVKNFGRLDRLEVNGWGTYEELRQKAKDGLIPYKSRRNEILTKIDLQKNILDVPLENYGWKLLEGIFDSLGVENVTKRYQDKRKFEYNLSKLLKLLVFTRIQDPQSKSATVRHQNQMFGDWDISQNAMDRGLDHLFALAPEIQITAHKSITKNHGRVGSLVFYDVTNFFFHIDQDDEYKIDDNGDLVDGGFRKKGFSKEHRPNPIVQLGLFMDSNSIPICFKIFPGNFSDPKTYIPAIKQLKRQFGLERIVTVADKAMNSTKNVTGAISVGDGYLFSSKVRGSRGVPKDIQEFALGMDGWSYNADMSFAVKSKTRKRKLSTGEVVDEKMVVVWSEKYAKRQVFRRNGALNHAQSLTNAERYRQSCKVGAKKFIEQYVIDEATGKKSLMHPFLGIDWGAVEEDEKYDGLNVLLTSELEMDDDEILEKYHALSKIEDCFRVTKTDFRARPVYVWTAKHIYAHFLSCFLALVVMRVLQLKLDNEYSALRIIDALNSAQAKHIVDDYYDASANEDFCNIARKLGKSWTKRNVSRKHIESLGGISV